MSTQAGQEVTELKEKLVAEIGKCEAAEKLLSDFQESLLKVTKNLEKVKTVFSEQKDVLTRRAEAEEAKLGPVKEELKSIKNFMGRVCVATFCKPVLHLLVLRTCCSKFTDIRLIYVTCLSFVIGKKSSLNLEVPKIKIASFIHIH